MLPLRIAYRFLAASKLQTVLITVGIAVGVSVQVFIGSLIQGLQNDLIDSTIGNRSHITIRAEERGAFLDDDPERFESLRAFDEDINVVNRMVEGSATLLGDTDEPILLRGFDFDDAEKIYNFEGNLNEGRLPEADDEVIIGSALLQIAEAEVGDTVEVFLGPPRLETFTVRVVGTFDLGTAQVNETWVAGTLSGVQSILDTDGISAYEMQLADVFASSALASSMRDAYPDVRINEWQADNQELLSGLEGQSISSAMIQVFVMVSVVLGIASVLAITVLQKSKQLGILKAMGITDRKASLIFLSQGFILGLAGAILGVLLGLFLAYSFTVFAVDAAGDPVVNVFINPSFIAISATIAVTASLIASIIPARRSARLNVIEVIRNG